jgi:rubrerythrin
MMIAKNASKDLMVESVGSTHSQLNAGMEYSINSLRQATPKIAKKEPETEFPASQEYTCPNCNGTVSEDDSECPHCHAEFEEI